MIKNLITLSSNLVPPIVVLDHFVHNFLGMMLHWVTICGLTISIMDMANAQRYMSNYTPLYFANNQFLKMRCGEFPPPLLKGGGKAYGHDVGGKSCTDGDKVGSTCKMLCPSTHPGWDQNRAQTRSHLESIFT